jgi:hypothetical protein
MTGTVNFKPSLVPAIPTKPNGKPGKDRKVKVTILATLTGCAHKPEPTPNDPATGKFKAKSTLPSRLFSQLDATEGPRPFPTDKLKVKWKASDGNTVGTSKVPQPRPSQPIPQPCTWTLTSATRSSFEGVFSTTSKTYPGSPFAVEVHHPEPNPTQPLSKLSFATIRGKPFDVHAPEPNPT